MARRSKVSGLPPDVKAWLDAALVEGNFSGYELREAELRERGILIGKSSLQRYGSQFERRLAALKLASEQAKAVVLASPDDEGAMAEALMRLVQERLFALLAEANDDLNLPQVARAVADLARAVVSQKKWQAEVRDKIAAKMAALDAEAGSGGLDAATLKRVREEIYGIV